MVSGVETWVAISVLVRDYKTSLISCGVIAENGGFWNRPISCVLN